VKVGLDPKKLKELREQNKLTQEQLADLLNISDRHLRNLESTCVTPTSDTLHRISQAFNIPMDDLITTVVE